MSATCDDCGRTVPPEETREGPYAHGSGRWSCLCCITEALYRVERWWPELEATEPDFGAFLNEPPESVADIFRRLGLT